MGRARTFGFSLKLLTAEARKRAEKLARKNKGRYEIEQKVDGPYLYYLPEGVHGSETQYDNGLLISAWVEKGEGTEPN